MKSLRLAVLFILTIALTACQSIDNTIVPVVVDATELEAFADDFFPAQMEALHIPGLVFVFVQDGQVLLTTGYGNADLANDVPMLPDTTVMRIGSISKTFVATAVMQLVEQGKLDLHADVNQYLTAFQVECKFRKPVTLAHLLTHTAGFEDPPYTSNTDHTLRQPLGPYLAAEMPSCTSRPGKDFRYSNHGYALAAYVVEEVSGVPFNEYVSANIMLPLGMTKSHYLLSSPVREKFAMGYFYEDGLQILQPVDYDNDYPAGAIVSTADDMAKFMLAHLQGGCYEGACILQPETLAQMQQQQAKTPYKGQAVTYGFTEGMVEGVRLIGHSGAIRGFGSIMDLLPEHNIGYFISFNEECHQTHACEIISTFRKQFVEHFIANSP